MSSTYFLTVEHIDRLTAFAYGDLAEVGFIAKRRIAEMTGGAGEASVRLVELANAGAFGDLNDDNEPTATAVKREVTSFTGDADTAALVLKRKLAAERKQAADAEMKPGVDTTPAPREATDADSAL